MNELNQNEDLKEQEKNQKSERNIMGYEIMSELGSGNFSKDLKGQHIVNIIEWEEDDSFYFLILEYCDSGTLMDFVLSTNPTQQESKDVDRFDEASFKSGFSNTNNSFQKSFVSSADNAFLLRSNMMNQEFGKRNSSKFSDFAINLNENKNQNVIILNSSQSITSQLLFTPSGSEEINDLQFNSNNTNQVSSCLSNNFNRSSQQNTFIGYNK
ncbi:Protein kinase-like domain [Pseudocohnilembus persalinus]|uniref:Protein kinase-like domain n=1 Tax=Pseudocohnilembus persalinus TaxID=266149 RepID=A0A0V0QC79_PSEPJ|nr:Protein kinase-like domain [Pseudocohnilembus persalinus]|eukprot:KRW99703.1 Protein kinase-like domain [Pseudocohnilembus persalinus]